MEVRQEDDRVAKLVGVLNDRDSATATTAERSLLAELEGGCQVPIGAYAELVGGKLRLRAMIAELDGTGVLTARTEGTPDEAVELGHQAAKQLLDKGAGEILARIRQE